MLMAAFGSSNAIHLPSSWRAGWWACCFSTDLAVRRARCSRWAITCTTGGLTVSAPLLPGHGGTLAEINRTRWREWAGAVEAVCARLQTCCASCVVAGFSMGSLLTLWLAENTTKLAGIVLYSPAVKLADWRFHLTPLLRYVVKSFRISGGSDLHDPATAVWMGGYDCYPILAAAELWFLQQHVLRGVARIRVPVLVVYSEDDRSIHRQVGPMIVRHLVDCAPVEVMVLRDSGHAITVDREWESVAEATYRFVQQCAGGIG